MNRLDIPLEAIDRAPAELTEGLPEADFRFAPENPESMATILAAATDVGAPVLVWGAGTHQGIGYPITPTVVISTSRLDRVVAWEPDDLTVVVEAGVTVGALEAMLAGKRQTAALPETMPGATVGGVVAAGLSGYRRARFGPTRDRMLEVELVTGDGRRVRGGGRVVKNVTGYDLPRLAAGSFGSIGVITSVCLKLWPLPERSITVEVDDPSGACSELFRPLAVLETEAAGFVYLQGTGAEVEAQARRLGGSTSEGLVWPDPPSGDVGLSLRVPPAQVGEAIRRLPPGPFVAQHGVGEISLAPIETDTGRFDDLRSWAGSLGGTLVWSKGEIPAGFDPWGSPPTGLAVQKRLMAAFDPARILNPGRMAGLA